MILIAAAVALYIASRAAVEALVSTATRNAGRAAIGHWLPILAVALAAVIYDRPAIAVGVIFATSVASLSLVTGAVTFLSPPVTPARAKKTWPLILPATLVAFLAGLRGELTSLHAIVLAIEGVVIALVWNDCTERTERPVTPAITPPSAAEVSIVVRIFQFFLAIALSVIGAWGAVRGVQRMGASSQLATEGLLAATMLAPMLVLPMLGSGVDLAHQGQSASAVSTHAAVVLLNFCLALPLVIVLSYIRATLPAHAGGVPPIVLQVLRVDVLNPLLEPYAAAPGAVPFARAVWRVDVIAVMALSLMLIPVAMGKWSLTKGQGVALIAGYAAYLIMSMAIGARGV